MKKRILIHDYAGHPFQVQLSRELARRGHNILHLYAGYNVTPRGELTRKDSDPETLEISPIFIRKPLDKYSYLKRWSQEWEYGRKLRQEIMGFQPDVLISANTPLDAQAMAQKVSQNSNTYFIFWLQDVIGLAAQRLLRKKLSLVGDLIGRYYIHLERRLLRNSDHIALITDDFHPLMSRWEISDEKTTVIPNWAPLESVPVQSKKNSWALQHNLIEKFSFMYTGTLGMKHNPDLLLQLALRFRGQEIIQIVVISEGPGADWLEGKKVEENLTNLILLPYQPFADLPQVMGTADVLIALLEADAGVFSVPSKVLTYLCAKRPILLAVPQKNLAARIVAQNQAGIVVKPDDLDGFIAGAQQLLENPSLCDEYARNGRAYAEKHFDIQTIGDRFEKIIRNV